MPTVRLSDVQWDNDVYLSYMQEDRTAKNAFIASGAAVTNAQLQQRAAGDSFPHFGIRPGDKKSVSHVESLPKIDDRSADISPAGRARLAVAGAAVSG